MAHRRDPDGLQFCTLFYKKIKKHHHFLTVATATFPSRSGISQDHSVLIYRHHFAHLKDLRHKARQRPSGQVFMALASIPACSSISTSSYSSLLCLRSTPCGNSRPQSLASINCCLSIYSGFVEWVFFFFFFFYYLGLHAYILALLQFDLSYGGW